MKKRLLFIFNAHAGREKIKDVLSNIIEFYSSTEYELIVHATQCPGDGTVVAEDYLNRDACELIVCSGGDGTIDEVAGAVMRSGKKIPVAVIPAGSTNDFGYTLGLPTDMLEASKVAISGKPFRCDIGSLNGRYFTYSASFGSFSDASFDTPQDLKNALGHAAYVLNGISKLANPKIFHMTVEYNGETYIDDYLLGMVVSSFSVGGFKNITGKNVRLDDGLHEVILVKRPKMLSDLSGVINDLIAHKFDSPMLQYAQVSSIRFSSEEEVAWSLDGEFGGSFKESEITVTKQGISYIANIW